MSINLVTPVSNKFWLTLKFKLSSSFSVINIEKNLRMPLFFLIIFLYSHHRKSYQQFVNNKIKKLPMPYRRLPNTDAARLKALKAAYAIAKELPPFKLAFSQSTFQKVQSFLPAFEKSVAESRFTYANQIKRSKEYQLHLHKARMYISHFIQVMNMAIQRGEQPISIRSFYGINENDKRLPSLTTEESVLSWGERVIQGEQERIKKGMSPITNPTVAIVKVRFEQFKDAYHSQKTMKKSTTRYVHELSELRKTADDIVSLVWDEVEATFRNLPEDMKREKCIEYGLVYVYRKNELNRISIPFSVAMPTLLQ